MFEPAADPSAREPFTAVLVTDPNMAAPAMESMRLAGGRLISQLDWSAVPTRLGRQAGRPVILVEAEGVAEPVLSAMLPRIDAIASTLDLEVVAVIDADAIDTVTATLFGPSVQLLCEPTLADRVAALAVAAETSGAAPIHDTWREGEAARLQRLNQEVARIAEVLSRLTRREGLPPSGMLAADVEDKRDAFDPGPATDEQPIDPAEVRRAIRARRLRDQFLSQGLFEDPAWDMILDLFAAELEGVQVSVSSLCIAAAVAPTTALRWINKMVDAGLFVREPDPFDRRRAFMALSDRASRGMRAYMAATRRAGLAIA
ncbi:hypothetical protein SAMN05192583_1976 [Sphingomonas gellani]|uniref:DNA-binding transcriptional regulator, MarR family n=2 Tax=Sphingomonas gellani TaxID=1166340 RepID=A0A1H8DLH0_9SPHN|nr:hypothetical protein SAMN05192583_1976 [Sphingomonas gellani]